MVAKQRELEELSKREKKYRNLFENSLAAWYTFFKFVGCTGCKSCFIGNVRSEYSRRSKRNIWNDFDKGSELYS